MIKKARTILNKYIEISTLRIIIGLIITVIFTTLYLCVAKPVFKTEQKSCRSSEEIVTLTSGINDDNALYQSFYIRQRVRLNRVTFKVSTQGNTVTLGSINVSITNKRNAVLASVEVPVSELVDNQDYSVDFGGIELDGLRRYYLKISGARPNGEADVCPLFYLTSVNDINGTLYVGNQFIADQALYSVYDYETIPCDWHIVLNILGILLFFVIVCSLRIKYIKYIPVMVLVILCFFMFKDVCGRIDWVNATIYNLDSVNKYFRNLCVYILISCVLVAVFTKFGMVKSVKRGCENIIEKCKIGNLIFCGIGFMAICMVFICQYKISYLIYQKIGWDVSYCFTNAWQLAHDGLISDIGYFSLYPNNKGLTMIMYWIIKIFRDNTEAEVYWKLVLINLVCIDIAVILMYNISKNVFGRVAAVISSVFAVLIIGFSGWIIVPYTDTFTIWIPLVILNLFLCVRKADLSVSRKNNFIKWLCMFFIGMITIWGYYIKPQCVIVTIAIALCIIPFIISDLKWIKTVSVLMLSGGILVGNCVYSGTSATYFENQIDNSVSMPMTHFMMMGLNENPTAVSIGGFDAPSVMYSQGYYTTEEKKKANIKHIKNELNMYGIKGFLYHIWDKAQWILSDGTFFWQIEGGFYMEDYSYKEGNNTQQKLREKYYGSMQGYDNIAHMDLMSKFTALWYVILLFSFLPVIRRKSVEKYGEFQWIIVLAVLGCIAFTLLFEGRSRYLINYIPFFCMLAGSGIVGLFRYIDMVCIGVIKKLKLQKKDG